MHFVWPRVSGYWLLFNRSSKTFVKNSDPVRRTLWKFYWFIALIVVSRVLPNLFRSLKTPGLPITSVTLLACSSFEAKDYWTFSVAAFIGFPFALVFTCTFTECVTWSRSTWARRVLIIRNFGRLWDILWNVSRVSRLNFTRESSFKGTPLDWALANIHAAKQFDIWICIHTILLAVGTAVSTPRQNAQSENLVLV